MKKLVETLYFDDIAIVTITNPPVNAMSPGVPSAVFSALGAALKDPSAKAIVLMGQGGVVAGADINTLGQPWPEGEMNMRDLYPLIEGSTKPIFAFIGKKALGGGLELAMVCHYRVADRTALLGQPEVHLGMPPGAGGTQRLPRLAGMDAALDMITGGEPISGTKAAELGLVDALVNGSDDLDAVAAFARDAALTGRLPLARNVELDQPDPGVFAAAAAMLAKRARGAQAPLKCVQALENATKLPFDEAVKAERKIFEDCVASDEGKAMRYVFMAERTAKKPPGIDKDTPEYPIKTAAVIGSGTMGTGIAITLANKGIPVKLLDTNEEALDRAKGLIAKTVEADVKKGRISPDTAAERTALVQSVSDYGALSDVDVVIEAVFEDMEVKKSVFGELDKHCKPDAILASNSSYLDLNEIAAVVPEREGFVLGMHFFAPANIMKLLEIVRTDTASPAALNTVIRLGGRLGKKIVVAGVCHGFIANRTLAGYIREAQFLLEEGSLPQDLDKVITDFGMPMGPFTVKDLSGLEVNWRIRNQFRELRNPNGRYCEIDDRLCDLGRFGQRTGAGYYRYENGARTPIPDPIVEQVILDSARDAGVVRRDIPKEEIIERMFLMAFNECVKVLQEGKAVRASDIDVAWIYAYGFPAYRGGPMFWAENQGLDTVLKKIRKFGETNDYWEPAQLLVDLVAHNMTFADYERKRLPNA